MIKLTFTGDLMCSDIQNDSCIQNDKYDYNKIFSEVKNIFTDSDYVVGNLETPIAGEKALYTKGSSFNTPEPFLKAIKESGFDFLSTANNHAMDRGIEGLYATIDALNKNKIDFTGTYKTIEDSEKIFIKEISGIKVALLTYTYGINSEYHNKFIPNDKLHIIDLLKSQATVPPTRVLTSNKFFKLLKESIPLKFKNYIKKTLLPKLIGVTDNVAESEITNIENIKFLNNLRKKIEQAKLESDIIILLLHCGGQYNNTIGKYTKYIYDILESSDVDLVIGNHPHDILPYKKTNDKLLAYSLGNFTFSPFYNWYIDGVFADYNIVLNAHINENLKKISKYSFIVIKNIYGNDGHSKPVLLFDLIQNEKNFLKKIKLKRDLKKVLKRFTKQSISEIKKEYSL